MPVDDIQVKRIPAVRVAELTGTAARLEPASINPVIQPLYRELGERLAQAGLIPAGPATSYYEDVPDGDGVIVHAALPVDADPGGGHGFEITDLPASGHDHAPRVHGQRHGNHQDPGQVDRRERLPQ
jgi:effector-binding domain-containing protein